MINRKSYPDTRVNRHRPDVWIRRKRLSAECPKRCTICGETPPDYWRLYWHIRKTHRLTMRQYYEQHEHNPCRICGKHMGWHKSRPKTYSRTYCSNICSGTANRADKHKQWKGGSVVGGYRKVSIYAYPPQHHPILESMIQGRAAHNYILEHRAVMAIALGRPITKDETIHHINGNGLDNRIENLELRLGAHGCGVRARDIHCPHCGKSYA